MRKISFILLCVLWMTSCTSSRLTSDVRPLEVEDLQVFAPFSYIHLIERGNKAVISDTLSDFSEELILKIMEDYERQNLIPITGNLVIEDTLLRKHVEKDVERLCLIALQKRSLSNLKIPVVLDSLLEKNGKRFGLISVATGFTREKANYRGQAAKAVAVGVLTLGLFAPVPIKSNSTIYTLIVDAEKDNIAFFRRVFVNEKEPLDKIVLRKQFDKIFTNYFWK